MIESFRRALGSTTRVFRFLGGASHARLALSVFMLYLLISADVGPIPPLVWAVDLVQLSVRRGRWLVRAPLYALGAVVGAVAVVASVLRLQRVEETLLDTAASLTRTATTLRRR